MNRVNNCEYDLPLIFFSCISDFAMVHDYRSDLDAFNRVNGFTQVALGATVEPERSCDRCYYLELHPGTLPTGFTAERIFETFEGGQLEREIRRHEAEMNQFVLNNTHNSPLGTIAGASFLFLQQVKGELVTTEPKQQPKEGDLLRLQRARRRLLELEEDAAITSIDGIPQLQLCTKDTM